MGLGSEIRDPEKTYSGSRIQGSKRHRIPDPDPQHWAQYRYVMLLMRANPFRLLALALVMDVARIKSTTVRSGLYKS
jgi:hypothetical protein